MIAYTAGFGTSALLVLLATAALAAEAPASDNGTMHSVARSSLATALESAVKQLTAEAIDVGKYKDARISPHFERPHPALGGFGPEVALDVLDRMLEPFAGNVYEDTYVRWHLMHVVKLASESDRRQMGSRLVQLVKQMPETLGISQRSEFRREPEDIAAEFTKIRNSLRVVIGYPPYQKQIDPPDSFDQMSAKRRVEAEVLWKKALKLRERYEVITDHDAVAFNGRIREVNWIVRQYRGELIYALFFTGDPEMVELIISTISAHASRRSVIAFDLMSFGYLAVFDGALDLYEPSFLKKMSNNLKRAAAANDGWNRHKGRHRNFADFAFHIISLLQDGGGFTQQRNTTAPPQDTDTDSQG